MRTHFLGREEVAAYLRDLAERLLALGAERPLVWCPIGLSGGKLAEELLKLEPRLRANTTIVPVDHDRDSKGTKVRTPSCLNGENVLVLDSSVHSGSTMLAAVHEVELHAPKTTTSYTLILKCSSNFVPTYWAVTIDDHDRAYFLLDKVPNNRLDPKTPRNHGHLRRLHSQDGATPLVVSGVASMDRITWEDRWWDMQSSEGHRCTYLLEVCGSVVGYLTYSIYVGQMTVDEVAIAANHQGNKYGGTLMRFAESMARQTCCSAITLWAIEKGVEFYKREDYEILPSDEVREIDGDSFRQMRKRILYHIPPPVS